MRNRGLCRDCGCSIPTPGPRRCDACRGKDREANRARKQQLRDNRRQAGLCLRCGLSAPADGKTSCEDCLAARRQAHRARSEQQRRRADRVLDNRGDPGELELAARGLWREILRAADGDRS